MPSSLPFKGLLNKTGRKPQRLLKPIDLAWREQKNSVLWYQIPEAALIEANLVELILHPGQVLSVLCA